MKGKTPDEQVDSHLIKQENLNDLLILEKEMEVYEKKIVKKKIVEFILQLYEDHIIQSDGTVPKTTVLKKFEEFVNTSNNQSNHFPYLNVGRLLNENMFLSSTRKGSNNFCISMKSVFEFRNGNLELFDGLPIVHDEYTESARELSSESNECNRTGMIESDLPNNKDLCKTDIEKEKIAEFVLKLYHDLHLQQDGFVSKTTVRREFSNFVTSNNYKEHFSNQNIGTLLRENKCLYNTPRGSLDYRISFKKIFEFRNEKLKKLDVFGISGNLNSIEIVDKPLEASIEVSPDAEEFPLAFQGSCNQNIDMKFTLLSLGCFICQQNFNTQLDFEDHISKHGFESDFELLGNLKSKKKIFEINYRLCNKSHYFQFTLNTKKKDVIIEKIIIIQTRSMQFVKNNLVPYELASDGIDSFLIDSHLFTIGVEQPVVVIYRYKSDKLMRFIEQHHFLRTGEFPQVHLSIRSCRISDKSLMKTKLKLREYYPSPIIKASQSENFSDESLSKVSNHFRNYLQEKNLNEQNMCDVLKTELQIEDLELQKAYLPLHQKGAKIKRFGKEYSVKLPKIPKNIFLENVVSPLDEIILTATDTETDPKNSNRKSRNKGKKFFAMIERVYYDTLCFRYDGYIISENATYDIILRPSRLVFKYQFRALELLSLNLKKKLYFFPEEGNFHKCLSEEKLNLFNPSIQNNTEQLQAVRNIAVGPYVPAPYVIFGPPGTGKTSTIVETVLQLWQRRPDTRVLITASSNSACDEVAIRLCKVFNEIQPETPNVLRIFAKSNEKRLDSIEDILIEASNFYKAHFYPSVESIRQYRIIVCTLSVVGKLVSAAIGTEFFTHIFIDECAASTEPEVLVGWMGTSSSNTRLIVSGDHKQLGPILKSTRAADLGLKVSLMERLLSRRCYEVDKNGNYDRSIQTRLIRNYRSHPEIVDLYNSLYYNNELKSLGKKDETFWGLQWHMLPNRNHPIIFHSVYGSCRKNGRSSISLCNEQEVNAVMDYVKDLMYFGMKGRKIEETDIGIISPYKKQYTRIQEELARRQWNRIDVGAVETFQGKEKAIIIVSFVRSFTTSLGFLDNPRRLNVILSRAKALLILIGNPKTLSKNKDFKFIIDECARKNCIRGGGGFNSLTEDANKEKGSNEKNLNLNGLNYKPGSSILNKRQTKKNESKPINYLHLKDVNMSIDKKIALEKNLKVSQPRSHISAPLKTIESNSKHENAYLTSKDITKSEKDFNTFLMEINQQLKTTNIATSELDTNHETTKEEYGSKNKSCITTPRYNQLPTVVSRNENDIITQIDKPHVVTRRHAQEEIISLPSRFSPSAYIEREIRDYDNYYFTSSIVNKKPEKRACVVS